MSVLKARTNCKFKDWRAALARLEGAYANSTLRAYRADMRAFEDWCRMSQKRALPAAPGTVAEFIAHEAKSCAGATLRRRLAAIRKIHRLLRMDNPVHDEEVLIAMRRALRAKCARPQQALGLTKPLRDRLIAACPNSLTGLRDRAMIALGYDTLCRRSELVGLTIEDISPLDQGHAQILIRRSKTDPYGQGRLGGVSAETAMMLKTWLEAANLKHGFIFRRVRGDKVGEGALHPYTVNRILKNIALRAGLPTETIQDLSGHSMRVGAAQDMVTSGMGVLPIMRAGGWRTLNVVIQYVANADLAKIMQQRRATEDYRP